MPGTSQIKRPKGFARIRLELAREPGHPEGSSEIGYDIVAPLDRAGRIDQEKWREHRHLCSVVRFRPGLDLAVGELAHGPGGAWVLHYGETAEGDEPGFKFGAHVFKPGEYVSILEEGALHTFRVVSVSNL